MDLSRGAAGVNDLLADLTMRAANTVLRARLAGVAWVLDRKRGKLGLPRPENRFFAKRGF